jgi:2-keto-4-pentenoate hydratase/2-oxohepta-3-ene-1,7-dioic acid hydratase in catechol pathway
LKLASVKINHSEKVCIYSQSGYLPLYRINQQFGNAWPDDLLLLIQSGKLDIFNDCFRSEGYLRVDKPHEHFIPFEKACFAPLYRNPPKIWGIGLNYNAHATDLSEKVPENIPGSFMKPDTTIIGHNDAIHIPLQSDKTTAEAELGIIIGKKCKDVDPKEWLKAVAGFTTIIDMTAEDILRKNPRYLTVSKSFDTFFSFGPMLLTPDEIEDIMKLTVSTVINGKVHASNTIANMAFPPDFLVSFHSKIMTLLPGDIISTGTPGAVPIRDGDRVECRIDGFEPLVNTVKDLKMYSG